MKPPRAIQRYVGVRRTRARGLRLVPRSRGAIVFYGLFNYPALFAAMGEVSRRTHEGVMKRLKCSEQLQMLAECEAELVADLEPPFVQTLFHRLMVRRQFGELVGRGRWSVVKASMDRYFRECGDTNTVASLDDALLFASRAKREGDIRFGLDILKARFEERKNRLPPLFRQECAQRIAELTALLDR